jgi:hypothetical protein
MSGALIYLGSASTIVSELSRSEQLFIGRWFQLLHDEIHPRWSIRPLSLGHLSELYQHTHNPKSNQLLFAIEDEMLRRLDKNDPDLDGIQHPFPIMASHYQVSRARLTVSETTAKTPHASKHHDRDRCPSCEAILTASMSHLDRLKDLVECLISSVENHDEHNVLRLTPIVAAEAVAAKIPMRFMLQACRGYVLKGENNSFRQRLYDFLRYDVAQHIREAPAPQRDQCTVRREFHLDSAAAKKIPLQLGNERLGCIFVERTIPATRRVWFSRSKIEDRLSRREDEAVALRALTPGWLAVLRFCFPDVSVVSASHFEIIPTGKQLDHPGHRRPFSRRQLERAFPMLETLIAHDEVRASLYWLSLAHQVWGESVAHAAGMVWMSIESLGVKGGLAECADAYVDRLQSQLADDIENTLGTLAGNVRSRKKGRLAPAWLKHLPHRRLATSDQSWLNELSTVAQRVCDDPLLRFIVADAASLSSESARETARAQAHIDLQMLRATRHAIAHGGKSIAEEPLMHYLASFGCECIRALLAKRLDGTAYEGSLEACPIFSFECEIVNDHWHRIYIPRWLAKDGDVHYVSASINDHTHLLTLTKECRSRLRYGQSVEVVSSTSEGHCHIIRLSGS